MIKLLSDSRDLHFYQHFGQVDFFQKELNFDRPNLDYVQEPGDTRCTAITVCDVAFDEDGVQYDVNDLFNRIPHTTGGAEPRDVLGKAVSKEPDGGLLPILPATTVQSPARDMRWSSYWRADTGQLDSFDNVRNAMQLSNVPVFCATAFYFEWGGQTILPVGKTIINYHAWEIEGWKEINGEPMLIAEMWIGRKLYLSREVFNKAMLANGCGTFVLSTTEIDKIRPKTILEKLLDAYKNLLLLLLQKQAFLKSTH